ncbi:hypothetical protein ABK040_016086 [Willaertia magna]
MRRKQQQDGLLLDFGENHSPTTPTTPTLNSPISNFEEDNEEKEEFIEHHSKKKSTKKSSKKKPSHLTTTPKHVRTTSTGSSNSNNSSTSTSKEKKASHLRTNSTSSSTSNNSPVFFPTSKLQQGYQSSSLYSDNNNNNDSYQQQDGYQASSSFGTSNNKSNIRILSKTNTMGNNKYQGFGSKDVYPQVISSDNSYNNNNKAYNNGMNNEGNNSPILSRERGKFEGISSSSFNSYNSNNNNNSYQSEEQEQQPGHIGSMKNNYYQQARQQMKEENESFSFLKVIADMLKYIYTTIVPSTKSGGNNTNGAFDASVQFPQPQIYLNDEMRNHLEQFKEFCKIPFQIENVKHQKLLFQLYKICTKKQTSEIHGEHWKYLGFQNTKPESDFRGAGLLGITNLIYFGKNYKKRFLRYFQKVSNGMELNEDGTFSSYPFVIAGLNVTMMLFDILGWGQNATKSHNIKARKKFIELLTSEGGKAAVVNEGDDDEGEDIAEDNVESECNTPNTASSGRTKEGTLLDFDDFLSSPNSTQKIVDSSIGNNSNNSNNSRRKKKNGKDEESPMSWSNNDKDWDNNNGEDSPVPTTKKTKSKRKKNTTTNHSFNLDFFNELYVGGFICLHKEWYKTKATYFEFGRVLANSRKHVEDLLELQFHSFDDVKHFNSIAK